MHCLVASVPNNLGRSVVTLERGTDEQRSFSEALDSNPPLFFNSSASFLLHLQLRFPTSTSTPPTTIKANTTPTEKMTKMATKMGGGGGESMIVVVRKCS